MKRIAILGSTGSIGTQTLDVVRAHPDKLQVVALACGSSAHTLFEQACEFHVPVVAVANPAPDFDGAIPPPFVQVETGSDAVVSFATLPDVDMVVNALVGAAGLRASYEALRVGKTLALANKESLVVGGDLLMPLARERARNQHLPCGALMPIDSEHGAIFQCLVGEDACEVARLWITASGGPFFGMTREQLRDITPAAALKHPTWKMGAKITIDSSTLMNKGLEVIEAHHLFDMPYNNINVVVQPQSAVHSLVEFRDGSVKAHMGTTDMRIPIQYALSFPKRWGAPVVPLDFTQLGSLGFFSPDEQTFRCLALARVAGQTGGTLPCVMNAANEVAVSAFLQDACSYLGIAECVEAVMDAHVVQPVESIEQLEEVDVWARAEAAHLLNLSHFARHSSGLY